MDSGVARRRILDEAAYRTELRARLNPTTAVLASAYEQARAHPKRVIFAEAEEEVVLRAALSFRDGGYGTPLLVGGAQPVRRGLERIGVNPPDFETPNARVSPGVPGMVGPPKAP